ncbi:ChbG/HpnK family deacetylase [Blastococcus sp. CT_GayMR20]|uniref:ChbG/HpnK family deacetylase n=1 Tax=Blastococcus sp. CT_GayMR20 TaxID=2559609 RepID=UPI0010739A78|nr:ChbG/HpnK family deacetylase [Blastococcus sp. CT_GayMR20]TFV92799.1 ChbG/HpnK family deacetylase [Blastococcus sp. CT_GayMR20]TFV92864.1 ChbG/HpnK family deacetylase [Blastococcus sp. CT_GayMR20]
MTRLLVINADDMGLTRGVCRAVARAHEGGIVTSTSVLAVGRAFEQAATTVRDAGDLAVGAHLAIVGEDRPLLSAREVPTLVDREGRFPLSYRTVVARGAAGRIDADDVAREFRAQLERVQGIGVPVTHLDTHQHTHLWPAVAAVVVDLAREAGIRAVRLPRSRRRGPLGTGVTLLAGRLRRRLDRAGLVTTGAYAGLDEAGHLDGERFAGVLERLTAGGAATAEVNSHPGEAGDPELARFEWGYRWADEQAMLTASSTRALVERRGWRLGTFADVAAAA